MVCNISVTNLMQFNVKNCITPLFLLTILAVMSFANMFIMYSHKCRLRIKFHHFILRRNKELLSKYQKVLLITNQSKVLMKLK